MKNIFIFIISVLLLASCAKQLEEKPQSIAAELFYNKPAEVEAGLNAIYEPIRGSGSLGALYQIQLEIYTEYMYGRGSHAPLNTYTGLDNNNITRVGDMWTGFYRAIRNANIVILRLPEATEVSAEASKRYMAEAKYMRALWYFHLVRNWAGVPLRTESNLDSVNLKRSTKDEVYNFIISDLITATNDLPEVPRLVGTPTKWAAKTVLTDVYMNVGKYAEARKEALDVIQSNKYSLIPVSVSADFEKIFGPDANNSTEEIFYLKFSNKVPGQGFQYPAYEHYPNSGYYPPAGFYTLYSDSDKNPFVKTWDKTDLRYAFNWYNQTFGVDATGLAKPTILEIAESHNMATGMVTTCSITHATPASFIAHQASRTMGEEVAMDFLKTDIDVFIGGGKNHFTQRKDGKNLLDSLKKRNYQVVESFAEITKITAGKLAGFTADAEPIKMLEGRGPQLLQGTQTALNILNKNPNGFFLMVEGSQIDWGSHNNDAAYLTSELIDFDIAVGAALYFAQRDGNTLVIVTGDHETGGLSLVNGDMKAGTIEAKFATKGHTGVMIPVFAYGPGAEKFIGMYENVSIFEKMVKAYGFTQ
jgi:hypothetical protein